MEFTAIEGLTLSLGESPVWDERRSQVFLCDITNNRVIALKLNGEIVGDWSFEANAGSLGLCESGRLVVALAREVILFDPDTGERRTLARLEGEIETNRFNDGKVGPDGCFWVGTMDQRTDREPIGTLYRVSADGSIVKKKTGMFTSNGLAWAPDGRTMFHTDSAGKWLDRHDFDPATGEIGKGVRIAHPDEETGRPDGGACDAEGFYWSAGVSAARLNHYDPDGKIVAQYPVPASAPTMPCFCGPDMKTMLVTSHRLNAARLAEYPLSGGIFLAKAPVAGAAVSRMKGL